jgi:hypothetical protein
MKSKVFVVNADNEANAVYASMFNCQVGTLPVKYLGVPVTFANLKNVERDFVDAKMIKKLAAWICDSATSGGRLTLLQSCLTGIRSILVATNIDVSRHILVLGTFILVASNMNQREYMFLMNKTSIEKLTKHMRHFFWQNRSKRMYYMVKWRRICKSKAKDGLGVKDLRKHNISLLVKWWWKLETRDGLWEQIVKKKHSPCWKLLLKAK